MCNVSNYYKIRVEFDSFIILLLLQVKLVANVSFVKEAMKILKKKRFISFSLFNLFQFDEPNNILREHVEREHTINESITILYNDTVLENNV